MERRGANGARWSSRRSLRRGPLHKIDIFPAPGTSNAPVHVFFHGGYWRAQDKANFAHVAKTLVAEGICAAIANYDLCPAVTLDGTVESALHAIAWTWRHAREYGGDPDRLTLSGHSAGAHLCAMALAHDWPAAGLPADVIKGAVPVSGIFDPEPAMHTTVNAEIGLTEEIARRNDALRLPPKSVARSSCSWAATSLCNGSARASSTPRISGSTASHPSSRSCRACTTSTSSTSTSMPRARSFAPSLSLAHGRVDAGGRRTSPEI